MKKIFLFSFISPPVRVVEIWPQCAASSRLVLQHHLVDDSVVVVSDAVVAETYDVLSQSCETCHRAVGTWLSEPYDAQVRNCVICQLASMTPEVVGV